MPEPLAGKIALVTGGTSGIGRAAAIALARAGARVVVAGRRVTEGQETVRQVAEAGGESSFVQADVTRHEEVQALLERAAAIWGRLDCAFNNAGITGDMANT